MEFRNRETAAVVDCARRATQRALDLLAQADGLEAHAFASAGSPSRAAIAATIKHVREVSRS